jgi:hypothetical protein
LNAGAAFGPDQNDVRPESLTYKNIVIDPGAVAKTNIA